MNNTITNSETCHLNPPVPPASTRPSHAADAKERRYLVILTGESLLVADPRPGCAQESMVHASANVLASCGEEEKYRAQEYLIEEDLLQVTAWSVEQIKAMCRDLEGCTLDPEDRVRLNQGAPGVVNDEVHVEAEETR